MAVRRPNSRESAALGRSPGQVALPKPGEFLDPPTPAMLFTIMQHVAALTIGFEIARLVVARIVIEVGIANTTLVVRILSSFSRPAAVSARRAPDPYRFAMWLPPRPTSDHPRGERPSGHAGDGNPARGPRSTPRG